MKLLKISYQQLVRVKNQRFNKKRQGSWRKILSSLNPSKQSILFEELWTERLFKQNPIL